ncbi:Spy/CpxP family protein refolding chaperone [Mucilaginibacter sp. ZT4R22]|uniref:Spy/CpxP family protein refolding chaperone n=1 Tax=Mucilaginibacter pankratovii TaxID=2772110 RepID=A0ABR7WIL6_9SPHI|nr:Spy/CpxP family protein refolding chaperone [Mucilaginibacter pankratovii]MBD1362186.1 Spy/CpxP family protein refolding chaperone [Mucilaginibacter pankratovii]
MKKIMLICCFLIGIATVSRAQGGGMRMTAADRVKAMKESLKLTDDQVTKITAVYEAQTKQMDSLRTAGADRSTFRPLMQATNDKVKALLTAEQAAAWQKEMDERRARMQNGGGGGAPPQK